MVTPTAGIHHVTAIAGDPQTNLDFYSGFLGMRLVKLTVNFDDPGSYHFYFGEETGSPGSLLTFFPHPGGYRGKLGSGQASAVAFTIAEGTLGAWTDRLAAEAISFENPGIRVGRPFVALRDPDGMAIELIESEGAKGTGILGIEGVTLLHADSRSAAQTLEKMGYTRSATEQGRTRFLASGSGYVDLVEKAGLLRGQIAVGSIHHVAFRTPHDADQEAWRAALLKQGYGVSPVMERDYFRSIYFREPGGVLFEIATDGPGFAVDEAPTELGTALKLPAWLEPQRSEIERLVPPLNLPRPQVNV